MKYARKCTSLQKNLTMKTSLFCLALAFLASCSLIDPPLILGEPRARAGSGSGSGSSGNKAVPQIASQLPDTSFFISAVAFPDSYDWQRDSAFGAVECTLLLYRNGQKVLDIPAGPKERISASPDKHHIIGGGLYTEYTDRKGTCLKRNGITIASWDEPERLIGLLYKDGNTHSLGLAQSGGTLTYRIDGKVALKVVGASAFGSFGSNGYGPTGALYEDEGQVCFAYKTSVSGLQSAVIVRDGKTETAMSAHVTDILDVKSDSGKAAVLYNDDKISMISYDGSAWAPCRHIYWQAGQLIRYEEGLAVLGVYKNPKNQLVTGLGWGGNVKSLALNASYVYCDGRTWHIIEKVIGGYPDCYFFHRNCACQLGNELAYVLTPRDRSQSPFMECGDRVVRFNLHGYLSGIAIEISK